MSLPRCICAVSPDKRGILPSHFRGWCVRGVGNVQRVEHRAQRKQVPEAQADRDGCEDATISEKVEPMMLDQCEAVGHANALVIPHELEAIVRVEEGREDQSENGADQG